MATGRREMSVKLRYRGPVPLIDREGTFTRPIRVEVGKISSNDNEKDSTGSGGILEGMSVPRLRRDWATGLSPWQRLHSHQTLSSIRRNAHLVRRDVPADQLDLVLESCYQHDAEHFPEVTDVHLLPETLGVDTWRLLRNTVDVEAPAAVARGHPLVYGGVPQRHSVNMWLGGHHQIASNGGYARKENGTFYAL